jgi:hypothetical protein
VLCEEIKSIGQEVRKIEPRMHSLRTHAVTEPFRGCRRCIKLISTSTVVKTCSVQRLDSKALQYVVIYLNTRSDLCSEPQEQGSCDMGATLHACFECKSSYSVR